MGHSLYLLINCVKCVLNHSMCLKVFMAVTFTPKAKEKFIETHFNKPQFNNNFTAGATVLSANALRLKGSPSVPMDGSRKKGGCVWGADRVLSFLAVHDLQWTVGEQVGC